MTGRELADRVVKAAAEIKAEEPLVLDLRTFGSITDYFVMVHGHSDRQVQAIADRILEDLAKQRIEPLGIEGYETAHWILIDFGDVVAHVFYEPTRRFYDLESLWSDAPRVNLPIARGVAR